MNFRWGSLEHAIYIAAKYHAGQLDKSGVPYILHPLRVMLAVQPLGVAYAMVGVLHDIIEDTPLTLTDLRKWGFSDEVCEGVWAVTQHKGTETYVDYVRRAKQHPIGKIVKRADIYDNMGRLATLPDPDEAEGLRRRYERALVELDSP